MDFAAGRAPVDSATVDRLVECIGVEAISLGISRDDVEQALAHAGGDEARAVDDLLSLMAIKQADMEQHLRAQQQASEVQVQWHELCVGLGLHECDQFMQLVDALPESEKHALASGDGSFFQQLLLAMDEEDLGREEAAAEELHPIHKLQALFPEYRIEVIEGVLDQYNYDVNAAATALSNIKALGSARSYSSVVSEQQKAEAAARGWHTTGPPVESLGHFPELPTAKPSRNHLRKNRKGRLHYYNDGGNAGSGAWNANAWQPTGRGPSQLTQQLKLDSLYKLFPTLDREVISTAFYLNECSLDATEGALREIYNIDIEDKAMEIASDDNDDNSSDMSFDDAMSTASSSSSLTPDNEWTIVQSRRQVLQSRQVVDERYCDLLRSFNRTNRVLALDRVRALSQARRDLRDAQLVSACFDDVQPGVFACRSGQPVDLHGFIVMEALQVVREIVEFCQEERIRRCRIICGVGHHSKDGKPRLLTATQVSLDRRNIAYRRDHGMVTIFPLRKQIST
ncbi:TPA: hypothetical protein N0F65_003796 [Lagenidium giganteum]|uniref:Smr domain-containing protein n=1 Tax=Lagenidium giganteum TaxID=4803 RepID=A0AAV2YXJ5_9STRA|nr:TPA: hypothetical protein N0F65_003796 [Lagenidium giganteum]